MSYLGNEPGLTNFIATVEKFTGTGACTQFQLAQNISDANAIDVRVSSVPQDPTTSYTLANGLITFTEAPPSSANNIVVTYRNTAVITYGNITGSQISDGTITAAKLAPGVGGDLWIVGLAIGGLGTILTGVNFITTIFTMRAPGMTMFRMSIFSWNVLLTSILVLLAFPPLAAAFLGLESDRLFGTHIFDPANGEIGRASCRERV